MAVAAVDGFPAMSTAAPAAVSTVMVLSKSGEGVTVNVNVFPSGFAANVPAVRVAPEIVRSEGPNWETGSLKATVTDTGLFFVGALPESKVIVVVGATVSTRKVARLPEPTTRLPALSATVPGLARLME